LQPIAVAMGKKANAAGRHLARCATHQGFCRPSQGNNDGNVLASK
jgi:hypothetical protein